MSRKHLIVAREKGNHLIQDFIEVARRLGCDVRWLEAWEHAPAGSIAVFTKSHVGGWTRGAKQMFEIRESFGKHSFQEKQEVARSMLSLSPIVLRERKIATLERAWTRRGEE